jgi:hypothetical protein
VIPKFQAKRAIPPIVNEATSLKILPINIPADFRKPLSGSDVMSKRLNMSRKKEKFEAKIVPIKATARKMKKFSICKSLIAPGVIQP